ncbi:hypothetical protein HYZ98_02970 [Candidatus Peregrinibacteria bacterium]|nr:hypothetical protein [Candidatus Peregrinibacteria bacterium]
MALTSFIEPDLNIKTWGDVAPYVDELEKSQPRTVLGLQRLIRRYSDLYCVVLENCGRAFITYSKDVRNLSAVQRLEQLINELTPMTEHVHRITQNILSNPAAVDLDDRYGPVKKAFRWEISSYAPSTVPLENEDAKLSLRTEVINALVTVDIGDQKEIPIIAAEGMLDNPDRDYREKIWRTIHEKRLDIKPQLDALFNSMVHLRHETGRRAGHPNYQRYMHWSPYPQHTIRQARRFHDVIEQVVVPVAREITDRQRERLGLTTLRPWDSNAIRWGSCATPKGLHELVPFQNTDELLDKSIEVFSELKPVFGHNLETMRANDMFDLDAKKGKGGFTAYCLNLEASGLPFVAMNASGTSSDVGTKMHEGGHAVHMFATRHDPLIFRRDVSLTMAETASIAMEFLTMDKWNKFYPDPADHRRAMLSDLEEKVRFLPWCAAVDKFQQWIYKNPKHTPKERDEYFAHLMDRFSPNNISWKGLERYRKNLWQEQDHIFSSPFYYIDYGFALLTAIQIYRNYLQNPKQAVEQYYQGLRMGGSKPYPRVWEVMTGKKYVPPGSPRFKPMVEDHMRFMMERIEELS